MCNTPDVLNAGYMLDFDRLVAAWENTGKYVENPDIQCVYWKKRASGLLKEYSRDDGSGEPFEVRVRDGEEFADGIGAGIQFLLVVHPDCDEGRKEDGSEIALKAKVALQQCFGVPP
ncbi:hypothetical protein HYDPIDRAFT_116431, partial [Hydnomerulius pinastri MD-312]